MVLGGQSREVIMLTDDNDHLPQPAASGQLLPVVVSAPKQTLAYLDFSIAAVRR